MTPELNRAINKLTVTCLLLRHVKGIIETEVELSGEGYQTEELLNLPSTIEAALRELNLNP